MLNTPEGRELVRVADRMLAAAAPARGFDEEYSDLFREARRL